MTKWCLNYESGEYEYIDRDGFSLDRGGVSFQLGRQRVQTRGGRRGRGETPPRPGGLVSNNRPGPKPFACCH